MKKPKVQLYQRTIIEAAHVMVVPVDAVRWASKPATGLVAVVYHSLGHQQFVYGATEAQIDDKLAELGYQRSPLMDKRIKGAIVQELKKELR
jgi:hypothetical protein